jgi:hypothetical protein
MGSGVIGPAGSLPVFAAPGIEIFDARELASPVSLAAP